MIKKRLILSLTIFLLVVTLGAIAYYYVEGWNKLDSLYFVIVTITTIGYGDLAPLTSTGKIFTIFFSFFGVAMAFYFVSLIGGAIFKKHVNEKMSEIKRDVKEEVEKGINKKR